MGFNKRLLQCVADSARADSRRSRESRFHSYGELAECEAHVWTSRYSDDELLFEVFDMAIPANVFGRASEAVPTHTARDAAFAGLYPVLAEMLTYQGVQTKDFRQTCTLIIVCEDDQWKLGLKERDRNVSLWVSGATLAEALAALEMALGAPVVAWRRPVADVGRGPSHTRKI